MRSLLSNVSLGGLPALGVQRPWLVTVMNLLIAIAGVSALMAIEVRELPNVDRPVVNVRATLPGASPETIDSQATRIIEGAVARVSGVKKLRSNSEENSSRITAEFRPGTNIDRAAADVREAVSQIESRLPEGIERLAVFKADEDAEDIIRIALIGETYTEQELAHIVERDVVPAFISIPGVADVPLFGVRREVLRIELDPARLSSFGLVVTDLSSLLLKAALDIPTGSFKAGDQTLLVRADAAATNEDEIGSLIIRENIKLRDVAHVAFTPEDSTSIVRLNGKRVLGVGIVRQAGSNTIQISRSVKTAIDFFNQQNPDLSLKIISDDAVFIENSVSEVLRTLIFAIIIVILTIRLFAGSWRYTIVPAVAIPVSLLGTIAASWILGFSVNILTLLAMVLATGLIVDDAIVVLESIQRRQQKGEGTSAAALLGTNSVFFAVIATTLVLVAVFVPIAFLPGTSGRLFREFGLVLTVAVSISSFVALSLVPALMARLGQAKKLQKHAPTNMLTIAYEKILNQVLHHPWITTAISVGVLICAASLFPKLQSELLPTEDRGTINIFGQGPKGVGLSYTERQADQMEAALAPFVHSGVISQLYTVVGRWDPNYVFITASLRPWTDREETQQEVSSQITKPLRELPGVTASIWGTNSLNLRGGGGWGGVQLTFLGNDYDSMYEAAQDYADAVLTNLKTVRSPRIKYSPEQAQISIKINRDRLADLDVSIDQIAETLRVMVDGLRVIDLNIDDQSIPIILEAGASKVRDPNDLVNLFVRSRTGKLIPLSSLVTITETGVPADLERRFQRRAIDMSVVLANNVSIKEALDDLMNLAQETLPRDITLIPRGEAAALGESRREALLGYGLALLIVMLVLIAQFESIASAAVILTIVPFGLAAAIFAMFITGTSLNIYSQVGLVMLIGLIAKNGILLVEFADQERDRGSTVLESISTAAVTRFRPIVMTLISTVFGALPLILSSGPGAEARSAVGWVVFGGLGMAAIFTLFLTPVVYLGIARFSKPRARAHRRLQAQLAELEQTNII